MASSFANGKLHLNLMNTSLVKTRPLFCALLYPGGLEPRPLKNYLFREAWALFTTILKLRGKSVSSFTTSPLVLFGPVKRNLKETK